MLTVRIVSTGYEVLRGYTVDTDGAYLARRATEVGASVLGTRTVGDAEGDVARAIAEAAEGADVVLVTGGLGPTEDDRTREAAAAAAGVALVEDPVAAAWVRDRLARTGREPSAAQMRQARLPAGARALENPEGTAPGVALRLGAADVYLLPGPPRELRAVFSGAVLPTWRGDARLEPVGARVLWTSGLAEADIGVAIADLVREEEPTVGTHPDEGEVAVRILARGTDAPARAARTAGEVRRRLGPAVFSEEEDVRLPHAVVRALHARRQTVTTAESVTGGLVARMLVEVAGSSEVFRGGFVTYSDAWKHEALGVSGTLLAERGAVSADVAAAMAEAARAAGRTTFGLATTGVAGPGPDARGVPEGTAFVALAGTGEPVVRALRFASSRVAVQRRVAVEALDLLRRTTGRPPPA